MDDKIVPGDMWWGGGMGGGREQLLLSVTVRSFSICIFFAVVVVMSVEI